MVARRAALGRFGRISTVVLAGAFVAALAGPVAAAKPGGDVIVNAPLKTAQPFTWSAPDGFFTGHESGSIQYAHDSDSFTGALELKGFKQAGPYVLTVDTADGATLADYGCDVWLPWAQVYGDTFDGGTNGCWNGSPYVDVVEFTLTQYDSNRDGVLDYYRGTIPFDVPLLNGTYNLKFFVKLDWSLTSPDANIMMMNDMTGDPKYGKVTKPKDFDYTKDLVIANGLAAEKLVLATSAWCQPGCNAPSSDAGYQGTTGVVFYSTVAATFQGTVVLCQLVTPPTPQPLQIKLEGLGSLGADLLSNQYLGYIGRWWDNTTGWNIDDATYEAVKTTHNVLGYVVFDGFDTATTTKTFALDTSYHTLPTLERGSVTMTAGSYSAYFALTENDYWWRGVFVSAEPLEFTIN